MDAFAKFSSYVAIFFCLDNFLCSCLIGEGRVTGGHAVDVGHFHKCGRPMILSVVPRMVKEVTTFPLHPCERHVTLRACLVPVVTIISWEMGTPASSANVWHFSCLQV